MRLVLDNVRDAHLLFSMAEQLCAHVPLSVTDALRLGRMTALQKPSGGERGIVAGDALRRLVAKTVAQQMGKAVEAATRPHRGRDGMHRPCAPGPPATRAEGLVQLVSCQGGRHWKVLVSRPGTRRTLDAFRDPSRRPPEVRDPIPGPILNLEPKVPFQFDEFKFASNVRSARRGATSRTFRHECRAHATRVRQCQRHQPFVSYGRAVGTWSSPTVQCRCPTIGQNDCSSVRATS